MARLGAYALMSSLVNLVANLLPEVKNTFFAPSSSSSDQAPNARSVEADLRRLERMMDRIKATLYDAEERNIQDQSVRLWLKEIMELGHEAEYVLEEYMYEVYRAQVEARNASELNFIKGDINVSGVYSVQIPYDIVDRIRDIKSRFEEIAKDREALCLWDKDTPRRKKIRYTPTPTSPLVIEESVFGREEEKEKAVNLLLSEGEVISVLPLVGKGGIGKTTMAQLIYNDKRLKVFYDMIGWVYVSDDFNIERITRDIIESFTREAYDLKNISILMEDLATIIRGRRVFLVLDDVWNEEPSLWESLCIPLMRATKATILVTTRNISVARIMQTIEPLLLEYLSDDKCWLLFTKYAFQGIDHANQAELVEIGKEIVKKCRGLPLAVKSIASLLSHEEELQSWMEILQSDLWESNAGNKVLAPLQISYERLPTYLKPCLFLCSMFPKTHKYSMNLMSRLWIANGYIEPKERKSIEEVAADYTKMLYERSFFDDYNIKCVWGGLSIDATFRLHDMVHDLVWLNSENTCLSVVQGRQPFISKEVRHVYLNEQQTGLPELLCSNSIPFMQTLVMRFPWRPIFHRSGEDNKHISLISLSKANHLRALDLKCEEEVLPFSLGNQKHLRYLFLGTEFVTQISPLSIFSCYSLRILILSLSFHHMEIEGIGNLINLEFFQIFIYAKLYFKLPESLRLLKKLRVLEVHGNEGYRREFNNSKDGNFLLPECIGNLVELHRIVIVGLRLQKLPESLCKLANLRELILPHCILKELSEDFGNLTSLQFLLMGELHYFPLSSAKLIPTCTMNVCNIMMQPDNYHGAVGWLKEFNGLKGALMVEDIQNITTIADAKNANLVSKRNLETLSLIWDKMNYYKSRSERIYEKSVSVKVFLSGWQLPQDYSIQKGMLRISIDHSINCKSLKGKDLEILEIFQPHPSLKHLEICSYSGLEFPRWMGDPLSCASLVKLWIRSCFHISSLPLGKVSSLKHLHIVYCDKLLHLKRESLPSQLKNLSIRGCDSLVEVVLLESLAQLEISICKMLKSLSTLPSKFASDHCHYKPSELKSRSLKKLTIRECPNLATNRLVLAEDCEVNPDWWYISNCYSDEGLKIIIGKRRFCSGEGPMRAFKRELSQRAPAVWSLGQNSDQNTAFTANSSPMNLAALYQTPFALMYNGTMKKAKMDAALQDKWLLVNIQSTEEFSSHMLNRDTWANETLTQIITSSFLFWQVYDTMIEGIWVFEFYDLENLPAILVINPITGQKMHTWTGMVQPEHLLEDLVPYLDKGPTNLHTM
ncbi:hypothetical protein LUZ63_010269 [Rhynchospora breviuscula]|uniref:UAS domain-containing protein n=1 Tax=Rhynchospora breviuscula TaxID=2022672 RepID=A0A9Q0CGN1_9POAL|nr:hypothetical protein LUZ63_010269 [Rhynchospora breviuscula]